MNWRLKSLLAALTSTRLVAFPETDASPAGYISVQGIIDLVPIPDVSEFLTQSEIEALPGFGGGESFPGVIVMYGGTSAPSGWLVCDGSEVSRSTYSTLFGIIGTTYGVGDGSTTFNLPDLRGRAGIGAGTGGGLTERTLGEEVGYEEHTLTIDEMPAHRHALHGDYGASGGYKTTTINRSAYTSWGNISSDNIDDTGGNSAHSIMQPSLVINFIIKY